MPAAVIKSLEVNSEIFVQGIGVGDVPDCREMGEEVVRDEFAACSKNEVVDVSCDDY